MARIADIVTIASEMASIPEDRLTGRDRHRRVVMVRGAIIRIARLQTPQPSYPAIGRALGGYDHSTMIHADRMVPVWCRYHPWFSGFVANLGLAVEKTGPFVIDRIALVRRAARKPPPPGVVIPVQPRPQRYTKPRNDFLSSDTPDWLDDAWAGTQALADVIAETRAV